MDECFMIKNLDTGEATSVFDILTGIGAQPQVALPGAVGDEAGYFGIDRPAIARSHDASASAATIEQLPANRNNPQGAAVAQLDHMALLPEGEAADVFIGGQAEVKDAKGGNHLVYVLLCTRASPDPGLPRAWTVVRRYRDFRALNDGLKRKGVYVPSSFPGKYWSIGMPDTDFLQKRLQGLTAWLASLLRTNQIFQQPEVQFFLVANANQSPGGIDTAQLSAAIAAGELQRQASSSENISPHNLDTRAIVADIMSTSPKSDRQVSLHADSKGPAERRLPGASNSLAGILSTLSLSQATILSSSLRPLHVDRAAAVPRQELTSASEGGIRTHDVDVLAPVSASAHTQRVLSSADLSTCYSDPEPATSEPRPKDKLGPDNFAVLRVIGKGSFGKVVLVRKREAPSQLFAMKILSKHHIVKRKQVEHTRTERRVLAYTRHPFIIQLHYAFQSADKLFLVLDYAAAGELFFHLSRIIRFDEPTACFYTAELVLALGHLHRLGVVYRDLKPENVLLAADGHIKLADFGLSKEGIVTSTEGTKSFCGTPEYLAPEILDRKGHGTGVDWWSLGMLLYEMLTGLPPWYTRDRKKLYDRLRSAPLEVPPDLSPQAKSLLLGLLTRDPASRLGANEDAVELMKHPFFSSIDWRALYRKKLLPPFVPQLRPDTPDTRYFHTDFTNLPATLSLDNDLVSGVAGELDKSALSEANPFVDFTYESPSFLDRKSRAASLSLALGIGDLSLSPMPRRTSGNTPASHLVALGSSLLTRSTGIDLDNPLTLPQMVEPAQPLAAVIRPPPQTECPVPVVRMSALQHAHGVNSPSFARQGASAPRVITELSNVSSGTVMPGNGRSTTKAVRLVKLESVTPIATPVTAHRTLPKVSQSTARHLTVRLWPQSQPVQRIAQSAPIQIPVRPQAPLSSKVMPRPERAVGTRNVTASLSDEDADLSSPRNSSESFATPFT